MKQSRNLGLKALIEVCGIEPEQLSSYHIGFVLGPCMNATGRLDTAKRALELLQSKSRAEAVEIAQELKNLNDIRKEMTVKGTEEAIAHIEEEGLFRDRVLVAYLPEVHESLAGIIAGRIREKYGRPAFVLTKGEEGVKGSGASFLLLPCTSYSIPHPQFLLCFESPYQSILSSLSKLHCFTNKLPSGQSQTGPLLSQPSLSPLFPPKRFPPYSSLL
ncbi:single-stranded-DNA-specific exonuclease RecJ [Muribaculaceae bacterium]|nr:single-stranded-DNA-specific exonuclease RecJ [Muribaculaceae bacterium]